MFKNFLSIIKISRFPFLIGGFLIYSLGYLISFNEFNLFRFILFYLPIFFGQLSVSYSNDFFDFETDKNGKNTLISGGSGVLQEKPFLLNLTKKISIILIFFSIIFSIILQFFLNPPIYFLIIVILANLIGWFYSAKPLKFSHNFLGEITMFLVVGLFVPIIGSIASNNNISQNIIIITPILFFYSILFSLSVQIPDYYSDKKSKKNNLTTKKGIFFSQKLSVLLTIFATTYLFFITIFFTQLKFVFWFSIIPLIITSISYFNKNKKNNFLKAFFNLNSIFFFIILCCLFILFF